MINILFSSAIDMHVTCARNRVFRDKSIAQYLLRINEAQAAVLLPRPPADSQQQQTLSSGEFVFMDLWSDTTHTLIGTLTAGIRERPRIYTGMKYIPR